PGPGLSVQRLRDVGPSAVAPGPTPWDGRPERRRATPRPRGRAIRRTVGRWARGTPPATDRPSGPSPRRQTRWRPRPCADGWRAADEREPDRAVLQVASASSRWARASAAE